MESIANFHFVRPGWLLMLPVAAFVWWLWQRSVEPLRGWRGQIDPDLLKAMTEGEAQHRDYCAYGVLVGWLIAIVAVAGPTWRQEPSPFAADATPLIVLLKADVSMNQIDPQPSAMERAKLKIADLAKTRKGQPLGLIAYAGSAHLVLPPTRDTSVVAEMAAEISPDIMPKPGDRLDLAIRKAGQVLTGEQAGGTLLVIADSIQGDSQSILKAHGESGSYPIQFLALRQDKSLTSTAGLLHADVEDLTPGNQDIASISKAAERKAVIGIAGQTTRWQEAGYWLVPLLVLIVAASFRRRRQLTAGGVA